MFSWKGLADPEKSHYLQTNHWSLAALCTCATQTPTKLSVVYCHVPREDVLVIDTPYNDSVALRL